MASYSDIPGSAEMAVVNKNGLRRTSLPRNDDVGIYQTEYRDDSDIQTNRDFCSVPRFWIGYTTVTRVTVTRGAEVDAPSPSGMVSFELWRPSGPAA